MLGLSLAGKPSLSSLPYAAAGHKPVQQALITCSYSCYFYCCRGAKTVDELTTSLLLRPGETAMLLQAAGIQTDMAGLAEKEPVLEVLLRRLATAVEAIGRLSRKRWASHIADMGAAEPAAAWQQDLLHMLLGRPVTHWTEGLGCKRQISADSKCGSCTEPGLS